MRPAAILKRLLIFVHRWLGVVLSILFMLWFLSGIVMMYWTYPEVTTGDRLARAPRLDPASITVSPEDAYAALGREEPPGQVRLTSFDGRPVYRFGGGGRGGGRGAATVYADDGSEQLFVDDEMIDRAASAWTGLPVAAASKESIEEIDQWTVGNSLGTVRPLYKYSWPDGQQVYVNGNTAEVGQYTTTSSRFWAYLGAIPHWLYFTPLRKHQPQWLSFVVWSSLIGTIAAVIGIVIIAWMYSPRKRYRHAGAPTAIPYRGWKRWHAITGLFFGVVTATWAFSGMLSLGPFPIMNKLTDLTVPPPAGRTGNAGGAAAGAQGGDAARRIDIAGALRGQTRFALSSYASKSPAEAIASLRDFDVRELEFTTFAGEPVYLATNGSGDTRIVPVDGDPRRGFEPEQVMRIVREAAGGSVAELRLMEEYDAYYLDRRGERPLPVVYARMNDAVSSRYYIDPNTGRVAGTYNARNWVSRWLYRGLHSLDFRWLF